MSDFTTKHAPIDDYPYICYAPDVNMNTENIDLPIASASTLGGVKIGSGIEVTSDGTISASGGGGGGGATPIITVITEDGTTTSDTTFSEIASIIGNGQFPIVKDSTEVDFNTYAYLQFFMPNTVIVFATPGAIDGNAVLSIINYAFLPDDSIQMLEYTSNH